MYFHVLGFVYEKHIIRNVLRIVFSMVSEMYSKTYFLGRVNVFSCSSGGDLYSANITQSTCHFEELVCVTLVYFDKRDAE